MNVAELIRKHRESRGLSQAEFGRLVGLDQGRVSNIEAGRLAGVGVVVALRIADRLGLPERSRKFVRDAYARAGIPYTPKPGAATP